MENIFNSITPENFFITTNNVITGLTPLVTLFLGIILGMIIIDKIVDILKQPSKNTENTEEYFENGKYKYRRYDPETEDDFPY